MYNYVIVMCSYIIVMYEVKSAAEVESPECPIPIVFRHIIVQF